MNENLKMTTDVKKQHTVPRFLLDKFGFGRKNRKRKLYTFDKLSSRVFQQSVFDATTRNSFYNIDNHPEQASLEPVLGMYENQAAPLIKEIIEKRSLNWMLEEDKHKISEFISIQQSRAYARLQMFNDVSNCLTEHLLKLNVSADAMKAKIGNTNASDNKNLFLSAILDQEEVVSHLLSKYWVLYETVAKKPFYISDNPIALHNDIKEDFFSTLGIAVEGIQIHLPLCSTLTLVLVCSSIYENTLEAKEIVNNLETTSPHLLYKIQNPHFYMNLATAFEDGSPLLLSAEDVDFLNSLQVSNAEQYVFCEKDSFDLARKMVSKNEILRFGPRMKIS